MSQCQNVLKKIYSLQKPSQKVDGTAFPKRIQRDHQEASPYCHYITRGVFYPC